ncbi:MAG: NAD(P)-binding protein [Nitrospirae bacterium]|nr:NAD(P)-binding protein [Nitrospirota bacterium]
MPITRRDFLNGTLLGAGALLLELPAPLRLFAQTSQGGGLGDIGDYVGHNGNTEDVIRAAHGLRDDRYKRIPPSEVVDTGEVYELVVIGGGLSGLGAAHQFKKAREKTWKCLMLENHSIFGGVAKRNEFMVNGHKLIGPQGSNSFAVINTPDTEGYEIYAELGIPRSFEHQELINTDKKLFFDHTNYGFMLWHDNAPTFGYFFDERKDSADSGWVIDMWGKNLERTPFPEKIKNDFYKWRRADKRYYEGEDFENWLDSMTYKDYLEKIMGLSPEITKFVDPVLASSIGLGSDVISAFGAYQVAMPGFQGFPRGFTRGGWLGESSWHSFPGGNDGFVRHLVKMIIPGAISGSSNFEDIMNRQINFEALDRLGNNIRIRLGALAVSVEHSSDPEKSDFVWVTYLKGGKIYRLKARGVVMACGSFVNRRIVIGLPGGYKEAYAQFQHAPFMIANVAVTNWNFLHKLGITAGRWFKGFGFSCNIRRPMMIGNFKPPLDPNKPALITFYVPFYYPGLPLREQCIKGRTELLSTSFSDYEVMIREQMVKLFGKAGFDPKKDIAGIILNRWGHAYVAPQPGFYFDRAGRSAPRHLIRKRFGRIAFAHSELNGHQHWIGAIGEGSRAAKQTMGALFSIKAIKPDST